MASEEYYIAKHCKYTRGNNPDSLKTLGVRVIPESIRLKKCLYTEISEIF